MNSFAFRIRKKHIDHVALKITFEGIDLLPWLPVAHVLALCICCLCLLETCGYTNVVNGTQSCSGSVPCSMKELFACVVYPVGNKLAKIDDEFGVWPKQRC